MTKNVFTSFLLAGSIRYLLMLSKFATIIQNRIEISTPLNSWKRVKEGAFLYNAGINPYSGDMYHENPILLAASNQIIQKIPFLVPILFIAMDLLAGYCLYAMAKRFVREMFSNQQKNLKNYSKDAAELFVSESDKTDIPLYVVVAYLFNPYSILNCVGQTTTVWSNLLLAVFFLALANRSLLLCCLALAMETQRNFYPFVLIVPAILVFSNDSKSNEPEFNKWKILKVLLVFVSILIGLNVAGFYIVNNWSFLNATYGFIFNHYELQPNIGLFWYFFTEMFEHFRTLFLYTFQLNATILYLFPLTVKLNKQPFLLATILTALITIFRSYPCIGDVAFYMALFPLWKRSAKFMANNFVVFCFFLIASTLGPTVWYLWIYCNSANANFYFGATLAFASAQIFLVTDLLFASNKREFCLENGLDKLTKIALE